MISKLPKWVWFGSAVLAFIAGTINTVGFLGFQHQGVTHLTGSTTLLGIATATGNLPNLTHLAAIIGSFLVGSIFGGILIPEDHLKLGNSYGIALLIESLLLCMAVPALENGNSLGDYLASCACGLQNGMASNYSGAILRTTHVSGIFTDLGMFIGHIIRRIPVDMRRVYLCIILLVSFFSGASLGAIGFAHFSYQTLYFPAVLTGGVGLAFRLYRHKHRKHGHSPTLHAPKP